MANLETKEIVAIICAGALGAILAGINSSRITHDKDFPENANICYANPRNIEFKVEDKDFDGRKETYLNIKQSKDVPAQSYLIEYENDGTGGKTKLVPYTIEHKLKETQK
jgi:hypothetical protein